MAQMFNPPHPGFTLRDDVLPALGVSVTVAADQLGVTRAALSRVLNGHAAISPEMALRIEQWLGIDKGGRASLWLEQQSAFDLWQAKSHIGKHLAKIKRVSVPRIVKAKTPKAASPRSPNVRPRKASALHVAA